MLAQMSLLAHSIAVLEVGPACAPSSPVHPAAASPTIVDRPVDQVVLDELAREKLRRIEVEQEVEVLRLALASLPASPRPTMSRKPDEISKEAGADDAAASCDQMAERPASVTSSCSSSHYDIRPFSLADQTALLFDAFPVPPPSPPKPPASSQSKAPLASFRRPRTAPSSVSPAPPPGRSSTLPYLVARPPRPPPLTMSRPVAPESARPSLRDGRHPFARARALSPPGDNGARRPAPSVALTSNSAIVCAQPPAPV
jgi:hypothetical protein